MTRLAWIWMLAALLPAIGLAQTSRDDQKPVTRSPSTMLATELNLFAIQAMASAGTEPSAEQMIVARILLDQSLALNDRNAEVWRRRYHLARVMADDEKRRESLRTYCRLRPDDESAQLELMLAEYVLDETNQTVDSRIEAVERALNDNNRDAPLSDAVKSRLASYIAKGARELGDLDRLKKYLKLAIALDSTNLEAARMTIDLANEYRASPGQMGVALIGLVKATPFDAIVRQQLADVLMSLNAYEAAAKQYEASATLPRRGPDPKTFFTWALSLAASGQPERALELLLYLEASNNREASSPPAPEGGEQEESSASSLDSDGPTGGQAADAPDDPTKPGPGLTLDLQLLRLVIYHSLNQKGDAAAPFAAIREQLQRRIDEGDEQAKADLTWISVWFGHVDDQIKAMIGELSEALGGNNDLVQRIRGFVQLHEGRTDQARDTLSPLVERDPLARYGYAQTLARDERIGELFQVMRTAPDKVVSVLVRRELEALVDQVEPSSAGQILAQMIERWPRSMRIPEMKDQRFVTVSVIVTPKTSLYLEPLYAEISIDNVSDWRLSTDGGANSLGPQRRGTIPTSALVVVSPRAGAQQSAGMRPIMASLDRRLALDPRETLLVRVPLEQSGLGLLMSSRPTTSMAVATKVLLDPRSDQYGRPATGPLGGTVTGHLVERRAVPAAQGIVDEWLKTLSSSDRVQQFLALGRSAYVLPQLAANADSREIALQAIDGFNSAFAKLDALGQAWVVRFLPTGEEADELFRTVHEQAQRSQDAITWISYLTVHVSDPNAPLMNTALRHSNPEVVEFAQALSGMLAQTTQAEPNVGG